MRKLLIFILAVLCIIGITFKVVTPISPETSLDYEFKLLKSEYLDDICDKFEIDIKSEVKNIFEEYNVTITDEEVDILLEKLFSFDYEILDSKIYQEYANVSVKITTVDLLSLTKEQIKANIGSYIVDILNGKTFAYEEVLKEVISKLEDAPKEYTETVNVRVNKIKDVFYLVDLEKNNDLFNAISGNVLYELDMLE